MIYIQINENVSKNNDKILKFVKFNDIYLLTNAKDKPIEKEHFGLFDITMKVVNNSECITSHFSVDSNITIRKEYFHFFSISQISKLKQLGYITQIISENDKKIDREKIDFSLIFKSSSTSLHKKFKFPFYDYAYLRLQGWLTRQITKIYNDDNIDVEDVVIPYKKLNCFDLSDNAVPFLRQNYPNIEISFNKKPKIIDSERQKRVDDMIEYMFADINEYELTLGQKYDLELYGFKKSEFSYINEIIVQKNTLSKNPLLLTKPIKNKKLLLSGFEI